MTSRPSKNATATPPDAIDQIDQALAQLPAEHLRGPYGLRELRRSDYLVRGGRSYPTVIAAYSAVTAAGRLYPGAFAGRSWLPAGGAAPVTSVVHALAGCSLARDRELYGRFARLIGREPAPLPRVVLLEKGSADGAWVVQEGGGSPRLDFGSLGPGADFALAYTLFVNCREQLRVAAPGVFQLLHGRLFSARRSEGARPHRQAGPPSFSTMLRA